MMMTSRLNNIQLLKRINKFIPGRPKRCYFLFLFLFFYNASIKHMSVPFSQSVGVYTKPSMVDPHILIAPQIYPSICVAPQILVDDVLRTPSYSLAIFAFLINSQPFIESMYTELFSSFYMRFFLCLPLLLNLCILLSSFLSFVQRSLLYKYRCNNNVL